MVKADPLQLAELLIDDAGSCQVKLPDGNQAQTVAFRVSL